MGVFGADAAVVGGSGADMTVVDGGEGAVGTGTDLLLGSEGMSLDLAASSEDCFVSGSPCDLFSQPPTIVEFPSHLSPVNSTIACPTTPEFHNGLLDELLEDKPQLDIFKTHTAETPPPRLLEWSDNFIELLS